MANWIKTRHTCLVLVFLLVSLVIFSSGVTAAPPEITASAAVVMEGETGALIYGHNPYTRRPPASTTKILSAILAIESGRLAEEVLVSRRAGYTDGSTIYLKPGEKMTLEELVWGALLESGNDACVAIGEYLAGSEEIFAELMNHRARALGAWDTHFVNPHGLPDHGHLTTAYDLARLARHGLQNPIFRQMVSRKEKYISWRDNEWQRHLQNTNALLWDYKGADGVKTGTTNEAGPCLVASATRDGRQLIVVVLNSRDRWVEAMQLLDYGFRDFQLVEVAVKGDHWGELPVAGGVVPKVGVALGKDLAVTVPRGKASQLRKVVLLPETIGAPLAEGQVIGKMEVHLTGEVLAQAPLIAITNIPQWTLKRFMASLFRGKS